MTPETAQKFSDAFRAPYGEPRECRESQFRGWLSYRSVDLPIIHDRTLLPGFSQAEWRSALVEFAYSPDRRTAGGSWILYVDVNGLDRLAKQKEKPAISVPVPKPAFADPVKNAVSNLLSDTRGKKVSVGQRAMIRFSESVLSEIPRWGQGEIREQLESANVIQQDGKSWLVNITKANEFLGIHPQQVLQQ